MYEDPDDVDARIVLGDALLEVGDPRGELIALQASRAKLGDGRPSKRERELIKKHRWDLLGRIAPAVLKNEPVELELGFASRVAYRNHAKGRERIGAPEWSTVRWIDVGADASSPAFDLLSSAPIRRHLRTVWRARPADIALVMEAEERYEWREIGVLFSVEQELTARAIARCTNLPRLERLILLAMSAWSTAIDAAALTATLSAPLVRQLKEVIIVARGLRAWADDTLDCVRQHAAVAKVRQLVSLSSRAGGLIVPTGAVEPTDALTVRLVVGGGESLAAGLGRLLQDRRIRRVRITGHTQSTSDMAFLATVARAWDVERTVD